MKTPACQDLPGRPPQAGSRPTTSQSAHSRGNELFSLHCLSKLWFKVFQVEIQPVQLSPEHQCKKLTSRSCSLQFPNCYTMASAQFILKNSRYGIRTHPKQSLTGTVKPVCTASVFSTSKHTPVALGHIHVLFFEGTELISALGSVQTFKEYFLSAAPTPELPFHPQSLNSCCVQDIVQH